MTPINLETRMLAFLKIKKVMLRKEIRAHFGLTNIQMNKISSKIQQRELIVSVDTSAGKLWHDKEYAHSQGIKPSKREPQRNWCSIAKGEQPYLDRDVFINSLWRVAV